jgi:hypothetical protein
LIHLSSQCSVSVVSTHRRTDLGIALGLVALIGIVLLSAVPSVAALPVPGSPAAAAAASAAVTPNVFNPPCASIVPGVCVSILNPNEPAVVPAAGDFNSPVQPLANTSIPLVVKSEAPLNQSNSARSGPDAPVILNVTGTLWNGVPYYSLFDGSVYHAASSQWWDGPLKTTNTTYPWWYLVNISSIGSNGKPEFFAGMSISWSIEITLNESGNFIHEGSPESIPAGPLFHFTYANAWPESPYQGALQYAGAAAYDGDLTTTVVPAEPNWNDSVTVSLNLTPKDYTTSAILGQAYLDLTVTAANGTPLLTTSLIDANPNGSGTGFTRLVFHIPAVYAQQANATVRYEIHASDAWGDWIDSGARTYLVGGNGTFSVGQFGDDLVLTASPSITSPTSPISPDTPVLLQLHSANQHTAIASAVVFYSADLPVLNEVVSYSSSFARVNSTSFVGEIPALPVGTGVNFTVEAWDFASIGETSPNVNYSVQPLSVALPSLAENGSFFYVAVHDAGRNAWVNGASVSVSGPGGYVRTFSHTFAGLTYPNASSGPFAPLAVPAGQTYTVTVTGDGSPASAQVPATHAMGAHRILTTQGNYSVYQEGDLIVFWLNSTAPAPTNSGPDLNPVLIGSILGLVAATVVVIPVLGWWSRIQKRREEETKRVTL